MSLFGPPLVAIGFVTSVLAMRRRLPGHDPLGFFIFLAGGVISAFGLMLMID